MRAIEFYKDYFIDFYIKQTGKVQEKIEWTLDLIKQIDRVPEK